MESFAASKPGLWIGRVMSTLFALFLLMDSTIKLIPIDAVTRTMTEMQLPATMARPIGIIELASLALYLWPRTAVLGAVLFRGRLRRGHRQPLAAGRSAVQPRAVRRLSGHPDVGRPLVARSAAESALSVPSLIA